MAATRAMTASLELSGSGSLPSSVPSRTTPNQTTPGLHSHAGESALAFLRLSAGREGGAPLLLEGRPSSRATTRKRPRRSRQLAPRQSCPDVALGHAQRACAGLRARHLEPIKPIHGAGSGNLGKRVLRGHDKSCRFAYRRLTTSGPAAYAQPLTHPRSRAARGHPPRSLVRRLRRLALGAAPGSLDPFAAFET